MNRERDARPVRGPHFFRENDRDMVTFTIDARCSLGPMQVTEEHRNLYPEEWAAYRDANVREMIG